MALRTRNAGICIAFVAVVGLQLAYGGVNKDKELPIKYPGPIQEITHGRYGDDNIPESCRNLTFCDIKPDDYPQEQFNKMFKGTKPSQQPVLFIDTLADRQGDPDDIDDCISEISFKPLYKVRNKRGDWRTVVQAPEENYVQMVRLESCTKPGKSCFTALPSAPDIKTFCKQKYSTWEFLVLDEENKKMKEKIDLPTCCVCNYKYLP